MLGRWINVQHDTAHFLEDKGIDVPCKRHYVGIYLSIWNVILNSEFRTRKTLGILLPHYHLQLAEPLFPLYNLSLFSTACKHRRNSAQGDAASSGNKQFDAEIYKRFSGNYIQIL